MKPQMSPRLNPRRNTAFPLLFTSASWYTLLPQVWTSLLSHTSKEVESIDLAMESPVHFLVYYPTFKVFFLLLTLLTPLASILNWIDFEDGSLLHGLDLVCARLSFLTWSLLFVSFPSRDTEGWYTFVSLCVCFICSRALHNVQLPISIRQPWIWCHIAFHLFTLRGMQIVANELQTHALMLSLSRS